MVQLTQKRTALLLYALLVVLPTAVLGALQWRQIRLEYEAGQRNVPERAHGASQRLLGSLKERVAKFLDVEQQRPFNYYARVHTFEGSMGLELQLQPSPLLSLARPTGIRAWFSYDVFETAGPPGPFLMMGRPSEQPDVDAEELQRLYASVVEILELNKQENPYAHAPRPGEDGDSREYELLVAAVACSWSSEPECLESCLAWLRTRTLMVRTSAFKLRCLSSSDGTPLIFATRRVSTTQLSDEIPRAAQCLKPLVQGLELTQGFLIDASWLLEGLPRAVASQVFSGAERLILRPAVAPAPGQATLNLLHELDVERTPELDRAFGSIQVSIDTAAIDERYGTQRVHFLALAGMLVVSLATGLASLWRSLSRQIQQVQRTENFVAAVTHELRTPLSAIRLHGEMLLDGWVTSPEQQQEYYRRIVRETGRLSNLVERVLEKSKLSSGTTQPVSGDLKAEIERLRPQLVLGGPPAPAGPDGKPLSDLVFYVEPGLPQVWLTSEAVSGILTNLIENARKYAAVDFERPGWEPIRVSTRLEGGAVLLEVADRGPGIPPEESTRVFEAFYRLGNEATRTAPGTGLGLHMCWMHARAIDGEVSVHPRPGGGAIFRVRFEAAG